MLPSLQENRLHRHHQTHLSESEGNFSIIRNTFDKQVAGVGGWGMNQETGVNIYTVLILPIKSMSKDLVYSTGKSTQCSVVK